MPWYRIDITAADEAAGKMIQLIKEFSIARKLKGDPKVSHLYYAKGVEGGVTAYISPDAAELAADILKSYGAAESGIPPNDGSVVPTMGPVNFAVGLLRAPQVTEGWVSFNAGLMGYDVSSETPSVDEHWVVRASPKGSDKSVALISRKALPDEVTVEATCLLDGIQKAHLLNLPATDYQAFFRERVTSTPTFNDRVRIGIASKDTLSDASILGAIVCILSASILNQEMTPRLLDETIRAVGTRMEACLKLIVERLSMGFRGNASSAIN